MSRLILQVTSWVFFLYEKHLMFRLKRVWGDANLRRISNRGTNIKVMGYTRFLNPESIVLGNNIRIGYGCFFFGKGGISIGDNTIISRNVTIYSSNHNYLGAMIPYDASYNQKPVVIGKGVWIGMGVSITPGVHIGDGAIIGMGAVISKNVGNGAIVVGARQREIGSRNMEEFYKLMEEEQIFAVKYPNH